ncbi:cytochrome-c peroxidase [Pseudoflavitalea sp. X16]|uniref:cytochrome-c peroxidase n=1 Tax=Paraflavitalea devenefica TaxID=2716334 RepID=UPI001423739B|nr:cytochrome c peroxidase [Paraflavitalea devenefica]NII28989.1 cytochrome-c peroxidase [Paraflavitalea devenefica]
MRKIILLLVITAVCISLTSLINNEPRTKAALGKLLFFDPILSDDRTISCASCHIPEKAFADTLPVSLGVHNRKGTRNTPSAMNVAGQRSLFWDGRAATLEAQALAPIENPSEMNLPIEVALVRLKKNKRYRQYFRSLYNSEPSRHSLADAMAAFERTLETSDSPFDNWKFTGDSNAVSAGVKRGFDIFNTKGKCVKCHFGADFTTHEFRNIGLFNGKHLNDSGRALITGAIGDIGKFKTPGLRNIGITAPYMHNGLFSTLQEVIEFYNDPEKIMPGAINRDTLLNEPMHLTRQEKEDLEAFLLSLTDKQFTAAKKN